MKVATADGGRRPTGVELRMTDASGCEHLVIGEHVLAIAPVQFGRSWLKDGFTRYTMDGRVGYGILEHGYLEEDGNDGTS